MFKIASICVLTNRPLEKRGNKDLRKAVSATSAQCQRNINVWMEIAKGSMCMMNSVGTRSVEIVACVRTTSAEGVERLSSLALAAEQ